MKVEVYAVGICHASACCPRTMPIGRVAEEVNRQHPTGVEPWQVSSDPTFSGGEPNPNPCSDDPERLHRLLAC